MGKWKDMELGEAMVFNPSETIKKGVVAKKIPMEKVIEFQRKISGFQVSHYNGGSKFRNGDTLLAKITPCLENGKTAQVDILEENEVAFGSTEFIVLRGNEYTISDFVYYLAKSPVFRKKAISCMEGTSGRKRVNDKVLRRQVLPIPDLRTQQQIAAVLSSLDSKIELNNKINAELETMAKTLYDYWFVQFEFPFDFAQGKPNEKGKPYKSSGGKMEWNEELKREIPEGWRVKKMEAVLKITRGASPRPIDDYLSSVGMPWVKISDATATDNRFITQTKQFIIEEGISKSRRLKINTLILSNSASPAIPRITKIETCVHDGWLIIDDYTHGLTKEFMLHFFEQERPRILNMGTGSIFKNLKTEYIKDLNILLPPMHLLEMAAPQLCMISETIYARTKESQTLTELRDWLLPMLMNGQVKVK